MFETNLRSPSHRRPAVGPALVALALGDAVVVTAFLGFGLSMHGLDPWHYPVHTVRTAIPFVLGWAIVAPVIGAYRRSVRSSVRLTAVVAGASWLLAALVGGAIRSTDLFPGGAPPEFLLVVGGFGLGFVLPWRLGVTAIGVVRTGR